MITTRESRELLSSILYLKIIDKIKEKYVNAHEQEDIQRKQLLWCRVSKEWNQSSNVGSPLRS